MSLSDTSSSPTCFSASGNSILNQKQLFDRASSTDHEKPLLPIVYNDIKQRSARLANGAPLGLFGFAIVSILAAVHKLSSSSSPDTLFFVVAFFLGGTAQFIASLIQFINQNPHGGTTFMVFGLHWTGQAIIVLLNHLNTVTFPTPNHRVLALTYYTLLTVVSIILLIPATKMNRVLSVALFFVIFAFGFDVPAVYDIRPAEILSAISAIIASCIALYMALAELVNYQWHEEVLTLLPVTMKQTEEKQEHELQKILYIPVQFSQYMEETKESENMDKIDDVPL